MDAGEAPVEKGQPFIGVDANYSLAMEDEGSEWTWDGKKHELFAGMARSGAKGFRVRLWTGEKGPNGKDYATKVVRRALAAGLDPYLVIFLSEDWADLMKQPAPAIWKDLDLAARAVAVENYSREVVTHFRKEGLRSHLYEIGNEIDYGICGVYPGKSTAKNPEGLSRRCWPDAAKLILASQRGVLAADPDAEFMLHIAHWWDVEFCVAFFKFMIGQGVRIDYAGLSYFPSSNIGGSLEMDQFGRVVDRLFAEIQRPIIIPETAYPSTSDFKGQFSRWKKAVPGYPLTKDGQRRWISDFLDFCAHKPAIASVYYWSPEWSGEGMWKAFALFDTDGQARPAWAAFGESRDRRSEPRKSLYLEARGSSLSPIPIDIIRAQATAVLDAELRKHGKVNVDYIRSITDRECIVAGYRVHLRASLSGNLDISPVNPASLTEVRRLIDSLDSATTKVVLFSTEEATPLITAVKSACEERKLPLLLHSRAADQPLKFGLYPTGLPPSLAKDVKE